MATEVSVFSAMARREFAMGKQAADDKPFPANYEAFVTKISSSAAVETHTYMSNLPRLREFKGYSPGVRLTDKVYTVPNIEHRIGTVMVRSKDLKNDQTGGYLQTINKLPEQGKKDIGHLILKHLAAGKTKTCFDETAFFANSHTFGTGDNLLTENFASNDAVSHRVVALITDNSAIKPVIFQDREPLSELMTDAETPLAKKLKEYEYWADCDFGLAYGFWWDAINVDITDTPTVAECYQMIENIINQYRTFTLPKGNDLDDALYVHEGWNPKPDNFILLCNLQLGQKLSTALSLTQYVTSTGNVDNVYKDVATVIPTSAL